MPKVQIKLTDEERADTIYKRVWQNATTTAIVDALIAAHPEWKDVPRRIIQDATRTCNPFHGKFAKKWKPLYASTIKHFQAERERHIQGSSLPASMAISKLIEKVLEEIDNVELRTPNDVLSIARSIAPIRKVLSLSLSANSNDEDYTEQGHDSSDAALRTLESLEHCTREDEVQSRRRSRHD
ncbi:MAG: hypothetical protein OXN17_01340 [Candidatus Poribacteria bacterium]|nr:hypothetical protein [Candidatus Poribacteria bacterium]MDE0506200.1 hypothetical protein [Candidatus Poribacteria bacterium]